MSLAWMTADFQNNCSMLSSQLENGTKVGRRSGTKMCWNLLSRPTTSQLTSGKPWPRTGRPGGQLFARAQTTLRKAVYRAWMKRDQQGRTECQTLVLLYLACSAARSALPLSGSKPICANTNTDASSSKSKDYYYRGCWWLSGQDEHIRHMILWWWWNVLSMDLEVMDSEPRLSCTWGAWYFCEICTLTKNNL